jgi:PTS system nitrogen regulatory IIA component
VSILIFLLVPEQATQAHLEILSELAQMLSDPAFRDALAAAPDPGSVHQMLVNWEPIRPAA